MARGRTKKQFRDLDPDEIFLDSSNLPSFDNQQFEGRLERPLGKTALIFLGSICALVWLFFLGQIFNLQVVNGADYFKRSVENSLRQTIIFPERGLIYDRNHVPLVTNDPERSYVGPGLGHILGYVGYPNAADIAAKGFDPKQLIGKAGIERSADELLTGDNGVEIEEVNVSGKINSHYLLQPAKNGDDITLTIDSRVQKKLYELISQVAADRGFASGAGVLMDVNTGELIALTSFPEYDPNILAKGDDVKTIKNYLTDKRNVFLDRAVSGLYTPGSIMKPYVALGALNEGIISPDKQILSTGQISVPNPFNPSQPSIFKDWKAHGYVDMRHALAVSSDVYFYEVGGGYPGQPGLGIARIEKYARMFGFGAPTGIKAIGEEAGTIPNPEWKAKNFKGEAWLLGDTYHTAIGQYGFQVTPLQIARGIAAIANSGHLVTPVLELPNGQGLKPATKDLGLPESYFQIVREGMHLSAKEGTAVALNIPAVDVAAKTGTAELGESKEKVNSWITGFFPYEKPHYVFAVVMEKGGRHNLIGAAFVVRQFLDWLAVAAPEYLH